jgi:hypothetical protein
MRFAACLSALLLLTVPLWAAGDYQIAGSQISAGNARFTVLSPTLVRMEYAPSGQFTDDPTVLVLNRKWPPCSFTTAVEDEWLVVRTANLELRWLMGQVPFSDQNLLLTWRAGDSGGTWRPGKPDSGNLGGTRGALDGIGRGSLPPIGPGLLSREGWTLLDDSQRPLWLGEDGWLKDRPDPKATDWYFFAYGTDYGRMLREYVTLCGKIPMLPRYSWGTWFSRYWAFTDEEEKAIVRKFRDLGIPLDVLVIDVDWHKYGWEWYDWNEKLFPDPEGFLKWCKDQGLAVTLNNHPGTPLPVEDTHHAAAAQMAGVSGDALKQPLAWNLADKASNRAFVEAVHWPLESIGIDFWWIDGAAPSRLRGLNGSMWCAKTYFDGTGRRSGQRSLTFSRYGDLGQHRYPAGFSGDVHSEWDVLNYEVRFTARAGNVCFPYWSHDIGGFLGNRLDPELYVRWCQFGALSPVNRLHSAHGIREPWEYGDQAQQIVGDYMRLRERLYPYLNTCQREVYDTGMPLCRALYMAWPREEDAYRADYEYLLGPNLLVAPVACPTVNGTSPKELWIPPGQWWDWWTGELYEGPRSVVYSASLERCPMFVRAGAILPMQPDMPFLGSKPADPLTIHLWPGSGQLSLYEDDGISLDYQTGKSTSTPMSLRATGSALTFTVGARTGNFKGALTSRKYELVLHAAGRPSAVRLNGATVGFKGAAPLRIDSWWDYAADSDTVLVHLAAPVLPDDGFTVTFEGLGSTAFAGLKRQAGALKSCAAAAAKLAAGASLPADVQAKIQAVASAADFARGLIDTQRATPDCLKDALDDLTAAWVAVGGSGAAEPARSNILRALAGLTTSTRLTVTESPDQYDMRSSIASAVPLPGASLAVAPAVSTALPPLTPPAAAVAAFSASGSGGCSYRIAGPKTVAQPPLGSLTLGADYTVTVGGVPVAVPARTGFDCSFVQLWQLIGPFSNQGSKGLETVYPPETEVDFTHTYPGESGTAKWQTTSWQIPAPESDPSVFINLEKRFTPKDHVVAYAVSYIISDREQPVVLSIGSDDGCKVWLNDALVLSHPEPRPPEPGQDHIPVTLKAGVNRVMMKVANEGGQWGLYLQVQGPNGAPLEGLRSSLTP